MTKEIVVLFWVLVAIAAWLAVAPVALATIVRIVVDQL